MSGKLVIKVSYDGTGFSGWQIQKNRRTVQGVLAEAWRSLVGVYEYPYGGGRTDSGVHAIGQVATFNLTNRYIPVFRYSCGLNRYLPCDVRVLGSVLVPKEFDSRRSALSRTYYYDLLTGSGNWSVQDRHYSLFLSKQDLRLDRLNELAQIFLGRQDFRAFCSSKDQRTRKVRTIFKSAFYGISGGRIRYEIKADGFLMRMVRFIVGNILFCYDKKDGVGILKRAILTQDKSLLGTVVSPIGLTLAYIEYPEPFSQILRDL